MIPKEMEERITRLHHVERWRVTAIAREVGVHHATVRRVLLAKGADYAEMVRRPSIVDSYRGFIADTLERYPDIPANRVYEMVCERGYPGGPDHFRAIIAQHRPRKPAEAFIRRTTLPGEEAQVDWGHFGKIQVAGGHRWLMAFVMVLSHSRQVFLRFFLDMTMGSFLRAHIEALETFGGVPRKLLYDNLKSVVLERRGDAIRFNPILLDFAKHCRFEPLPCNVRRGNEKGRVERAIRYIRTSFFPAREFTDLADLNAQADRWCLNIAGQRKWQQDPTQRVIGAFHDEQPRLMRLPDTAFPAEDRVGVAVGKVPYARFDSNDYSVPPDRVRRTLAVIADFHRVRVVDGAEVVADHPRSWGKRQVIEDPAHLDALLDEKRAASRHRGQDRLSHAAPSSKELILAAAERGHLLGTVVSALLRLLDTHGAEALENAIVSALAAGTAHAAAVRQLLERRRQDAGQPPALPVELPADTRVRDLAVRPHDLGDYDKVGGGK